MGSDLISIPQKVEVALTMATLVSFKLPARCLSWTSVSLHTIHGTPIPQILQRFAIESWRKQPQPCNRSVVVYLGNNVG